VPTAVRGSTEVGRFEDVVGVSTGREGRRYETPTAAIPPVIPRSVFERTDLASFPNHRIRLHLHR
jgi:hypothetical protein